VLRAAGDGKPEELRERLLDALVRERVELHVPAGYAPRLGSGVPDADGSDLLGFAAEGLLVELGVAFPPFAFAGPVREDVFTVTLNHLPTLPTRLLEEDECLVNDTAERLALAGVEARATVNPATEQPASIAPLADRDRLDATGLTTWDPPGFLILTLADALRRHAGCFVTSTMIDARLDALAVAAPALVNAARQTVPPARLTALTRALVSEQVSIQDLRAVLERLIDLAYTGPAEGRWALLDDPAFTEPWPRLDAAASDVQLVRFVRAGLRRRIVHKQARGTATLVVYLLDPQIEQRLREDDGQPGEAYEQRLLDAIGHEMSCLPPTAMVPAILTQGDVRAAVRATLRATYPRIPVLAYDELTTDLNVQPVARITLAEPEP
jgi:type III secretion protein V